MAKSLQDILRRRQQEEFVGREEQLAFFRRNLSYASDDDRRRFVVDVSGQGGVGKTWLLRRFRRIAEEAGAITACTDEVEDDVPSVMGCIAEQFAAQDHSLKTFAEQYKVYRQWREEIEADPEARSAFPTRLGRALAKGSLDLARAVPGVGAIVEILDEEPIVSKGGEFAAYVARKVRNKEEVHLVLEPIEVLTPLFLVDLRQVTEKNSIALFFDTYERTGDFLDPWLRDLLEGRHGDVPANILLVIAGRDELDRNCWAPYEGLLARLPLEPFTAKEAYDYLTRRGVTDERVVEVILGLSGRLPLLVATLAAESPDDPAKVGDPSGDAVERFLKWVEDPKQRQVALNAALPRRLNRDVLAVIVGEDEADALFAWLREMPFVERWGDGWAYHEVVRMQMLRYKRQESPQGWVDLHQRLAEFYENLRDGLGLEEEASREDEIWQGYALQALYHRLCQAPQVQLTAALNGFLAALEVQRSYARRWAEMIARTGSDVETTQVWQWGRRLVEGTKAYEDDRHQMTAEMFTSLIEEADLETQWRTVALASRGVTYRLMNRYNDALADFNQAIESNPHDAWITANRGETYRVMNRNADAVADFDRAIELDPDDVWAIASRGQVYQALKQYQEALADFDRAIELDPDLFWAITERGELYRELKRYEDALADFDRAIERDPDDAWVIGGRGETYRLLDRYEEALTDFARVIELKPDDTWVIARRGAVYREMERYEEALADLNRALDLDLDDAYAIAERGTVYSLLGRYEEALVDLNRAIELDPEDAWAIAERGGTYRELNLCHDALADFNRAIDLDPDSTKAIAGRGETYRQMGRYKEALADFDCAIELRPDDAWAIASRGEICRLMGCYEQALADFDRAAELEPDYAWAIAERGEVYRRLECFGEALAEFDRAIGLEPDDAWAIAHRGIANRLMERYEHALADFDRAIELEPGDDGYHYERALTHQIRDQEDLAREDLTVAIRCAGETYEKEPQNWRNTFNLALYSLAAGTDEGAERLYREALSGGTASGRIRDALHDLDDFLALFPDHAQARAMRGLLQEHLEESER